MTPQKRAQALLERENIATVYAKMVILETVDANLSDAGFRLLSLLRQRRVVDIDVSLGYAEIAFALSWSRPKTIRTMNHLLELAYCDVRKRHNQRNSYILQTDRPLDAQAGATRCVRCKRDAPLGPMGVCAICRKRETAGKEVAEHYEIHGPCTLGDVWKDLKGNGSKSSQPDIARAYNALLDSQAKQAQA